MNSKPIYPSDLETSEQVNKLICELSDLRDTLRDEEDQDKVMRSNFTKAEKRKYVSLCKPRRVNFKLRTYVDKSLVNVDSMFAELKWQDGDSCNCVVYFKNTGLRVFSSWDPGNLRYYIESSYKVDGAIKKYDIDIAAYCDTMCEKYGEDWLQTILAKL